MKDIELWYTEVVEISTDKIEKRFGPFGKRKCEKLESGLLINLNEDKFFTRVVPATKEPS